VRRAGRRDGARRPAALDAIAAAPRRAARVWRRLRRHKGALISGGVVALFLLVAVLAPPLAPFDPTQRDWLQVTKPPSLAHPLGTDDLGRDGQSRLIGGRGPRSPPASSRSPSPSSSACRSAPSPAMSAARPTP
jgi:hypothetical protein